MIQVLVCRWPPGDRGSNSLKRTKDDWVGVPPIQNHVESNSLRRPRKEAHTSLATCTAAGPCFISKVSPNCQSAATLHVDVLRCDVRTRWLLPEDFLFLNVCPSLVSGSELKTRSFSDHVLLPRLWSLGRGFTHQTAPSVFPVQRWQRGALDSALRRGSHRRRTCGDRGRRRRRSVRLPDSAAHAPSGHHRWVARCGACLGRKQPVPSSSPSQCLMWAAFSLP